MSTQHLTKISAVERIKAKAVHGMYRQYDGVTINDALAIARQCDEDIESLSVRLEVALADIRDMKIALAAKDSPPNGWRREFIDGNGVDREVWVSPDGKCYDTIPSAKNMQGINKAPKKCRWCFGWGYEEIDHGHYPCRNGCKKNE